MGTRLQHDICSHVYSPYLSTAKGSQLPPLWLKYHCRSPRENNRQCRSCASSFVVVVENRSFLYQQRTHTYRRESPIHIYIYIYIQYIYNTYTYIIHTHICIIYIIHKSIYTLYFIHNIYMYIYIHILWQASMWQVSRDPIRNEVTKMFRLRPGRSTTLTALRRKATVSGTWLEALVEWESELDSFGLGTS